MGFWNDYILDKNPVVVTSKLAGKGLFQTAKKITGSDKMAASIQQGGDPFNLFTNGKNMTPGELGVSEDEATNIRRGQQAGRLTSMAIAAAYFGGSALAGGGATAGGGAATGSGGGSAATGLELEAAAGTGQGAWTEPATKGGGSSLLSLKNLNRLRSLYSNYQSLSNPNQPEKETKLLGEKDEEKDDKASKIYQDFMDTYLPSYSVTFPTAEETSRARIEALLRSFQTNRLGG